MVQNAGALGAHTAMAPSARARQVWLATADLLESDRGGWLLSGIYAAVLAMSAAAAIVTNPERAGIVAVAAVAAGLAGWLALAWKWLPVTWATSAAATAVAATGL